MFTLKIENAKGQQLTLTQNESNYQVVSVGGLNPPTATVITNEIAGMDGSKFQNSKLEKRNMVITVKINGDVEANRINLYNYFRTKQWVKVYYKNDTRDVYIEGYIDTTECNLFAKDERMQISIICPDPYFKDMIEIITDISEVLGNFTFPFSFGADGIIQGTITDDAIAFSNYVRNRVTNIFNAGEETGLTIEIRTIDTVVNPVIFDAYTREQFKINITLIDGDYVLIDTNKGRKSITLTRNNTTTNIINNIARNSTWLSLKNGDNQYAYDCDSGSQYMNIVFKHTTKYEAV